MSLRRSFLERPPTEGEYFTGRMPRSRFRQLVALIGLGMFLGIVMGLAVLAAVKGEASPVIAKLKDWVQIKIH